MKIIRTAIEEVCLLEPQRIGDHRGYFSELFRQDFFAREVDPTVQFVQENESLSSHGVLRGLHYQKGAFAQAKLVRVLEGEVLDVAVDIRRGSPTFAQHVAVRLSETNGRMLYVPRGFAHGFAVLSNKAKFAYKCDNYYAPQAETGIAFDDPQLGIDWLLDTDEMILSEKDKNNPPLSGADELFSYGKEALKGDA